jgi:bifunctional non-homologous end joining protein LigD
MTTSKPRGDSLRELLDRLPERQRELLRAESTPTRLEPMLATLTERRFSDPDWIFERKLDGVRCVATRGDGRTSLLSRNGHGMDAAYPEIVDALEEYAPEDIVLDGEIVAFEGRRTSFARLQGRMQLTDPNVARKTGIAVFYYVFDLLHLDGTSTRSLPLTDRKSLLRRAVRFHDPLRFTTHRVEAGEEAFRRACARGDEGVIAKRRAARYSAGRSGEWLKFKCVRDQEFVIGGYTLPQGSRTGFGALLLGYYDGGTLVYAGKVGTGFNAATLHELHKQMAAIEAKNSPFGRGRLRERDVRWVRPQLIAQIGFSEWTGDGMLRHPRFQGVRTDKDPHDVVRETR